MVYTRVPGQYSDVQRVTRQLGFQYQEADVGTLTNGTPGLPDSIQLTTLPDIEKYWIGAPIELSAEVGYARRQRGLITGISYTNGSLYTDIVSTDISNGNGSSNVKLLSFFTNIPLQRIGLTQDDIMDYIREAEDWIDDKTHHSYLAEGRRSVDEKRGLNIWKLIPYPNMPRRLMHYPTEYYYVSLDHTNILPLDPNQGDSLKIYNGTEWKEWLTGPDAKVEGTDDLSTADFWIDYLHGYIFFLTEIPAPMDTSIKVTYRFSGNSQHPDDVPETIKYMTTRRCCINLLESERVASLLPGGKIGGALSIPEAIALWYKEIYESLANYKRTFVWSQTQL